MSTHRVAALGLALLAPVALGAQAPKGGKVLEEHLRKLILGRSRAGEGADTSAFRRFTAPNASWVGSIEGRRGPNEMIADMVKRGPIPRTEEISDLHLRRDGSVATADFEVASQETTRTHKFTHRGRVMETFVLRDGAWLLLARFAHVPHAPLEWKQRSVPADTLKLQDCAGRDEA